MSRTPPVGKSRQSRSWSASKVDQEANPRAEACKVCGLAWSSRREARYCSFGPIGIPSGPTPAWVRDARREHRATDGCFHRRVGGGHPSRLARSKPS